MKKRYSVRQVASLAGISIRTLHLYDRNGLLKPAFRAESGYRYYTEPELLRLQQVFFYKELGFRLAEIADVLDDPEFDLIEALTRHKAALLDREARIATLIRTIDTTIGALKNKSMIQPEELYEGLPAEQAAAYRREAIAAYGPEIVEKSEAHLMKAGKTELKQLVAKQKELAAALHKLMHLDPSDPKVQDVVQQHYENTRKLWGTGGAADKQAATYKGLGLLYLADERFTLVNDAYNKPFAEFMAKAMDIFAKGL